ncbi:MAG: site-specific integrase [Bacteroidia bacterium]|nr:site-specific integrase [Bacteroidia bacterium]
MTKQFSISLYLDTRRSKVEETAPLKVRVYSSVLNRAKFYSTVFQMTRKEFESIWETTKPRLEHKEMRMKLQAIEDKAFQSAMGLDPFTFEQFESKFLKNMADGDNILYYYDSAIQRLTENNQFGTASNYRLSKKSLIEFVKFKTGREANKLAFVEVNKEWLQLYEQYMIETLGRTRTTVSMYLRVLRTIFNNALSENEISREVYPFGEKKYQIPTVRNIKKALSPDKLKILFEATPETPQQEKAKDFWFFSYACNGMNMKDILLLKWEDYTGDTISFYRAKTINTNKGDLVRVVVYLNEYSKSIIEKYGAKNRSAKEFIFNVLNDSYSKQEQFTAIKNFTRFVNQNFKKMAENHGITESLSTYWARHSFATTAIRKGASIEFVSEALSHSNVKTTQTYFAGFEESSKRDIMNKVMEF